MTNTELASIKALSNSSLLQKTNSLVREERNIGIQILYHLKEIGRRRLHCELGYSSLFTYAVEYLKYPESTAYRLVSAMKLLRELREVEQKVESGSLSISTLSMVHSYCQAQKRENQVVFDRADKVQVLASVEGCSRKETEKVLASWLPEQPLPPPDRQRPVSPQQTEIKMTVDNALLEKLERIKELIAHCPYPYESHLLGYFGLPCGTRTQQNRPYSKS
jgi:hypothetical protein